jgi:HNH endonuclease
MNNVKIPKTTAGLRKLSALMLNPVTLPDSTVYRFTQAEWVRFVGKLGRRRGGCWIWAGSRIPAGYGKFYFGRGQMYAHRVTYMLFVGDIPAGLHIDHLCRNPPCCNPAHLEPVTCAENVRRSPIHPAAINAQKTECIRGHPLSGDNVQITTAGRSCRACNRANCAAKYARSKAALSANDSTAALSESRQKWRISTGDGTNCRNGHELTDDNIHTNPAGRHRCRRCNADSAARRKAKAPPTTSNDTPHYL